MVKRTLFLLPLLVASTSARPARADAPLPITERSSFLVSFERTFGFTASSTHAESQGVTPQVKSDVSATNFSFLASGAGNPYAVPRVGFDLNFSGFTLGGGLGYLSSSSSSETTGVGHSDGPTSTGFLVYPRVGYLLPIAESAAIWFRAGVTYWSTSSESTTNGTNPTKVTSDSHGLALGLDPSLVFFPLEHVGFTLTAALDFGVSGGSSIEFPGASGKTTRLDNDATSSSYGVLVGMLAAF